MIGSLNRRDVVARLMAKRGNALVVTGLGAATYDVAAAGDTPRNFYLWGAMGGAAALGCGLALAQPDLPVVVVTGDGEMLMGMGTFATIAQQAPANLSIVVLDNGLYGETGAQASHTSRASLAAVAKACGIAHVEEIADARGLDDLVARFPAAKGPHVAVIKIAPTEHPRLVPLRDGAHAKARTRLALGLPAD